LLWFDIIAIPLYMLFLFPWWIFWIGKLFHIFSGPHFIIIILTLYALKKEKHRWMWPMNLYAVGKLHISLIFLNIFSGHHEDFLTRAIIIAVVKAIVLLIGVVLFWRLAVFHTTRKYFEAKAEGVVDPVVEASGIDKLIRPI
uniref:DUF2232 domain-containing protein n=1 Tax=Angiostrongylus cantonensis TaxID=6313 RepID=A0A0K0DR27_ANGCA